MINYDLVFFGIFLIFLTVFYFKERKKIQFQGIIALYRTKLGTLFSKKVVSKAPTLFKYFGYLSIFVGFSGMVFILFILIKGGLDVLLKPSAKPVVAPVLPFIKIPGLPTLLFSYWIIGIFVVAVIHEFSHALLSVVHKVKIKSSGFAFFGPIPAAFVEPNEKQLSKKSKAAQLSIFSAGPTSNIITGFIFLAILLLVLSPAILAISNVSLKITDVKANSPAEISGLKVGMTIERINNLEASMKNISKIFSSLSPGDRVIMEVSEEINGSINKQVITIKAEKNPKNSSRGYIGISIEPQLSAKKESGRVIFNILIWVQRLFFWLFVLSTGIGLFNLLPLGPIDGGRMLFVALLFFTKKERAKRLFNFVSLISLIFVLINLLPWIIKLFYFLGNLIR